MIDQDSYRAQQQQQQQKSQLLFRGSFPYFTLHISAVPVMQRLMPVIDKVTIHCAALIQATNRTY